MEMTCKEREDLALPGCKNCRHQNECNVYARIVLLHQIVEHVATDGAEITPELVEAARQILKGQK